MTYIAAFRCANGIVMCADTQETRGESKNYVEKLEITENGSFPLAIGGAGVDDIIRPFTQEIMDRVEASPPSTKEELKLLIRESIKEVYEKDLPILVIKKQHHTPHFIIAAKPKNDDFCIFTVVGRRLYRDTDRTIIGYPSAHNFSLLKRLHNNSMPMAQAVALATYLVAQSIKSDEGVGGDPRVVVVRENRAWIEPKDYIKGTELRFDKLNGHIDRLMLTSLDFGISEVAFLQYLDTFREEVLKFRHDSKRDVASNLILRSEEPGWKSMPYSRLPVGTEIYIGINSDSNNPQVERIIEPDFAEGWKRQAGPFRWMEVKRAIVTAADAARSANPANSSLVTEGGLDWSILLHRPNDGTRMTMVNCDPVTFTITASNPNPEGFNEQYRLDIRNKDGDYYYTYMHNDEEKDTAEIAARIVASVTE